MSKQNINKITSTLARTPNLANSFVADPVRTIEALGAKLEPSELELVASLDKESFAMIAQLQEKVKMLDPAILAGHSGGFIY